MKRYDSYTDTGIAWIGEIPSHWEVKPFKYSMKICNGMDYKHVEKDEGFPVIGSGGIFAYASHYMYDGEALLLGRKGTIDKPIYFKGKFWTVDTMFYAIPNKDVNCKYMYYQSTGFPFDRYSTATALPSMTSRDLNENLVCIPPRNEQEAIADYLDRKCASIDVIIATQERRIALLNELKQSIITEAVTRGINPDAPLRDSGIDWIGKIPEHWEVMRLKFWLKEPLMYGANEAPDNINDSHPRYIRITDIDESGNLKAETFSTLSPEKADSYLLKLGDILFARSGATVGKSFIFNENYSACFAGYLIKASPNEKIGLSEYIYLFTKSTNFYNWKDSINVQATIQNIGADKYANLYVPFPTLSEQKEIVEQIKHRIGPLDSALAKAKREIELLREYKQSVITEAVTGKIKVC